MRPRALSAGGPVCALSLWFGVMAYKAAKNTALWAIGGGLLGLVVTTTILGLAQATFIPFDSEQIAPLRLKAAVLAILLVAGVGWLFTGSLHRHLFTALKPPGAPPAAPPVPAKPPASGPKQ